MALKQGLHLRLQQKLSPQQIQLMKLIQIPTVALEERIKEELEMNPALEEGETADDEIQEFDQPEDQPDNDDSGPDESLDADDSSDEAVEHEMKEQDDFDITEYMDDDEIPDYKLYANNTSPDEEERESPLASGTTFRESLVEQLGLRDIDDRHRNIAEYIIGNLDDDGYLRRDLLSISDDLAFKLNIMAEEKEILDVLHTVQELDPAGVGARDLQECLLLQLKRRGQSPAVRTAQRILTKLMDEFSKKHYERIMQRLGIGQSELKAAMAEILHLNPRPGNSTVESDRTVQTVVPDFFITNTDGKLELTLNGRNSPSLRVSQQYRDMLKEYSSNRHHLGRQQKDAVMFVKEKLDGAKWFIDAIKQRQITLLTSMDAIMEYQKEYFLTGDETKLKPMILKDIAEIVGMDISTISRMANSKYVQTQFGTLPLKYFFSESLSTDSGEEVSSREVKKILEEAIGAEDKHNPLPDEQLAEILHEKGYNIARRTIAKYREQLGLPVARMRKEL